LLHSHRRPSLLNIDIAQAFEVLEILQHMGFSRRWREWISIILSSASTRILLNGNPADRICHTRGLRQSDPLSHMIFMLVMEVLNGFRRKADEWSLLRPFGIHAITHRASLYAHDLVVFISPKHQDLFMLRQVLDMFQESSSLGCNLAKCQMVAIRCNEEQITRSAEAFPYQLVQFPVKYLGLPLSVFKLLKSAM
jgi:hypothetical protein